MSAPRTDARPRRPSKLAWIIVAVLVLAACASPSAAPTDTGGDGDGMAITISGSAFSPESITIAAGEALVFTNNDGFGHQIVEGENGTQAADPAFEAIPLSNGQSSDPVVFDAPGTYNLTCTIHPSMSMTVTVE